MEEYTSQFKVEDTWESEIETYVTGMPHVTVAQVLKGLDVAPAQQSRLHNTRVEETLLKLGWSRTRKRVNGNANATRVWVPPQHLLDAIQNVEETF
jgi:predicted P-loop ATPase